MIDDGWSGNPLIRDIVGDINGNKYPTKIAYNPLFVKSAQSIINRVSLPVPASSQFHQSNNKAAEYQPISIEKQNVSIPQTNNILSASANQTTVTRIVADSEGSGLNKNLQKKKC